MNAACFVSDKLVPLCLLNNELTCINSMILSVSAKKSKRFLIWYAKMAEIFIFFLHQRQDYWEHDTSFLSIQKISIHCRCTYLALTTLYDFLIKSKVAHKFSEFNFAPESGEESSSREQFSLLTSKNCRKNFMNYYPCR